MSRWSSLHRVLLIVLALGLGPLLTPGAQDTVILRNGPDPVRGIPYLATNALPAFQGAYLIGPKDFQVAKGAPLPEPRVAKVLYARVPLVLPEEWIATGCGSLRLLLVSGQEHYTLCYRDEQGYTLFFQFLDLDASPEAARQAPLAGEASTSQREASTSQREASTSQRPLPQACAFAESFVRRFQVLLGLLGASREPPFPAILQLPR